MNKHKIYLHIRLNDGVPFYVGKGTNKRMNTKSNRNIMWNRIVSKYDYDIIILEDNLSEEESFIMEKYWINRIGRKDKGLGPLFNFTDGGEGISGYTHTDETKNIISQSHKGKSKSLDTRIKMSLHKSGNNHGQTGENHPMYGRKHSKESIKKMSECKIGKMIKHNHPNYKEYAIEQFDLDGNLIKEWLNHHDACEFYNIKSNYLISQIKFSKNKKVKGFIWKSTAL